MPFRKEDRGRGIIEVAIDFFSSQERIPSFLKEAKCLLPISPFYGVCVCRRKNMLSRDMDGNEKAREKWSFLYRITNLWRILSCLSYCLTVVVFVYLRFRYGETEICHRKLRHRKGRQGESMWKIRERTFPRRQWLWWCVTMRVDDSFCCYWSIVRERELVKARLLWLCV